MIHLKYNWLLKGVIGYTLVFRVYLCMGDREKQFQMCVGPQLRFCEYVAANCTLTTRHIDYFSSLWHFNHEYPYSDDKLRIGYAMLDNVVDPIYVDTNTSTILKVNTILI